ncbi:MFS transporter [Candidatus Phycosocius spiralis]|uniref:MFS transporter n=1 Tax=Candidatus Phycosocius spiralis TaxID=2815099 RepID=A0ABQ4PU61_9PROT|nr:MFS transporter [Candidatus Phycosocius spiralis]GIU66501.1 MFS transporter [Candidatus Phycosocius spiralis]
MTINFATSPAPNKTFRLLFACLTIVGIGNSMLFAVLPPIAREAGMPDWSVSTIFTLSAVLWVLTSPVWGKISDTKGRKPLIVMGLSSYALSTVSFTLIATIGLVDHFHWFALFVGLAAARSIFGAFGSATNPAAQAYVADTTAPEIRTREIAAVTSAFAFGSAAGPALAAGMVASLGLLAPLFATSTLAVLGAISARVYLPKVAIPPTARQSAAPSSVWRLAFNASVQPWLLFGVVLSAVTAVMFQQISFYFMDRLAVSPREGATLTAVSLALGALSQIVAQLVLIPRLNLSPRWLVVWGSFITGLGAVLTALGGSFGVLCVAQALVGLGFGLARPGFTGGASLSVSQKDQGSVAGLVVAANGAGFVTAPLFGAGLYAWVSHQAPFYFSALILFILAGYGMLSNTLKGPPMAESPPDQPGV